MELEQLASFVRYQLGQKQGWEALDEVLTVVQESAQRVKEADKKVQEAEDRLRKIEELCERKLDEAEDKIAAVESTLTEKRQEHQSHLEALAAEAKASRDLMTDEVGKLQALKESLRIQITGMSAEVKTIEAEKHKAQGELNRVNGLLADLKARL